MTPQRKNLKNLYALLNGQGRLLALCSRKCAESRVKKDHQAFAVTNSIEFKEVITSTHMCSRKKENLNKAAESTSSLIRGIRSQGKVRQTLSSKWFELISPSRLQFFDVWFHFSVRKRCLPLYQSMSYWSLVCGSAMVATPYSSNFTPFKWRAGRTRSCGGFLPLCTLSTDAAAAVFAYSLYIAFHLSRCLPFLSRCR